MKAKILTGDCLEVLRGMPSESVHCCVTSPPYYGLRDYGVAGQIGLEESPDAFVARLVEVFREVRRVLRDDGTLWLNLGDSYSSGGRTSQTVQTVRRGQVVDNMRKRPTSRDVDGDAASGKQEYLNGTAMRPPVVDGLGGKQLLGIPWRVAFALQADGWYLRQEIIWHKPSPMPESVTDRCTKAHEQIFLLAKSQRYFYDAKAVREKQGEVTRTAATFRNGGDYTNGNSYHNSRKKKKDSHGDGAKGTGRNRRSVWTVASQPYAAAHFATYPPKLIEPCIMAGTSEEGCCPQCLAPYQRITERTQINRERPNQYVKRTGDVAGIESRTVGWEATCQCNAGEPIPCTVLDPFNGSGTTGQVALNLGRDYVGIELNPEYVELTKKRLRDNVIEQPIMGRILRIDTGAA